MKVRRDEQMTIGHLAKSQKGNVIIMAAFLLVPLIAFAGLAIDLGRYFVVRAELVKAVDGGALAGARVMPTGQQAANEAAHAFANMNFPPGYHGVVSPSFNVEFFLEPDQSRILVTGSAVMPTTLMKVVGLDDVTVNALAEAVRRPLELALVLDTSGSLRPYFAGIDAIGYLRTASRQFVSFFDDDLDMMALVRFASGRTIPFPLGEDFKGPIRSAIAGFEAEGGTGTHDAVATGHDQIETPTKPGSFRTIVFFTDGRPTCIRDIFTVWGNPRDAVIGGYQDPDESPYPPDDLLKWYEVHDYTSWPSPDYLPDGQPATTEVIMAEGWQRTLDAGSDARDDGITIFTIGLGNPNAGPIAQPDPSLLIALANVESAEDPLNPGGTIINNYFDPSQPKGGFFFAPDATELEEVFQRVAQEITVRLTR
jgi:hypothetical protein